MAIEDYSKATKTELTDELVAKYREEKLQEIVNDKVKAFNDAKEAAIEAFKVEQDVAKQALIAVWQTAEDNDYTIPQ